MASGSNSSSILLTLFILAIVLSPALVVPSEAARFPVPETAGNNRLICINCICCEPAPSRKCACCVCP